MKKNITINMYGTLYAIDEDACQLLESYLDNMKSYFAKREGGDEIADDIEHRVAEILSDLKAQGVEAISVQHVQDIISRVGNPEEMDDESGLDRDAEHKSDSASGGQVPPVPPVSDGTGAGEEETRTSSWFSRRRLFRDPDDVMIGGVMAGVCKYFGGNDPLPYRILMVLLALLSFSTMGIIYLLAWAIIPQARTAEERLQMQGKPVNPEAIKEEVMRMAGEADDYVQSPQFRRTARSFWGTLLTIIVYFFKGLLLFVVSAMLIAHLIVGIVLGALTVCSTETLVSNGWNITDGDLFRAWAAGGSVVWQSWGAYLFALAFLGITFYGVLRWILRRSDSYAASPWRKITLAAIAIISLAASLTLVCTGSIAMKNTIKVLDRKENTIDGIYLKQPDRSDLADMGWNLLAYANCNVNGYIFTYEQDWSDEDADVQVLKFDKSPTEQQMQVKLERTDSLPAGYYRLRTLGYSSGSNAFTYLKYIGAQGTQAMQVNEIERTGSDGRGNLADIDLNELKNKGLVSSQIGGYEDWDEDCREAIRKWMWRDSPVFYHAGGPVTYGITNLPNEVGRQGHGSGTSYFCVRELKVIPSDSPAVIGEAQAAAERPMKLKN